MSTVITIYPPWAINIKLISTHIDAIEFIKNFTSKSLLSILFTWTTFYFLFKIMAYLFCYVCLESESFGTSFSLSRIQLWIVFSSYSSSLHVMIILSDIPFNSLRNTLISFKLGLLKFYLTSPTKTTSSLQISIVNIKTR